MRVPQTFLFVYIVSQLYPPCSIMTILSNRMRGRHMSREFVMQLMSYFKMHSKTSKDKLMAYFLSKEVEDLIVNHLTLVRQREAFTAERAFEKYEKMFVTDHEISALTYVTDKKLVEVIVDGIVVIGIQLTPAAVGIPRASVGC